MHLTKPHTAEMLTTCNALSQLQPRHSLHLEKIRLPVIHELWCKDEVCSWDGSEATGAASSRSHPNQDCHSDSGWLGSYDNVTEDDPRRMPYSYTLHSLPLYLFHCFSSPNFLIKPQFPSCKKSRIQHVTSRNIDSLWEERVLSKDDKRRNETSW